MPVIDARFLVAQWHSVVRIRFHRLLNPVAELRVFRDHVVEELRIQFPCGRFLRRRPILAVPRHLERRRVQPGGPERHDRKSLRAHRRNEIRHEVERQRARARNLAHRLDLGTIVEALVLPARRARRRHHATVAAGVQRIHVAAMVEQRRYRSRMDGRHVIHLHVRFHRDLPVAVQLEAVLLHEAQRLELELAPLRQKRREFLLERTRVGVEIHEQELAEAFDPYRIERTTRLVEADEVALVAQRDQRSRVVVNPAVIAAHQLAALAVRLAYECGAAMTACVVEGAHLTVVGVKEHHALLSRIEKFVATRLRNFVEMAREQPRFAPQVFAFERVEMRVCVAFAG